MHWGRSRNRPPIANAIGCTWNTGRPNHNVHERSRHVGRSRESSGVPSKPAEAIAFLEWVCATVLQTEGYLAVTLFLPVHELSRAAGLPASGNDPSTARLPG